MHLLKFFFPLIVRHYNLHRSVTYGSCLKATLPEKCVFLNDNKKLAVSMTVSRTKYCDLVNFVMTSMCLALFEKLRYFFFFQYKTYLQAQVTRDTPEKSIYNFRVTQFDQM